VFGWVYSGRDAETKLAEMKKAWLRGKDIPFVNSEAEETYRERVGMITKAIELGEPPNRVPVCPSPGFFPLQYAGFTPYDGHYDTTKLAQAWEKYYLDFDPDSYNAPSNLTPGKVLDILDCTFYHWPGHGIGKDRTYQFVEKEYMKAEEYRDFIEDPTGFFLNAYFPRIFRSLKGLEGFPLLPPIHELPLITSGVLPFGTQELQASLEILVEAGKAAQKWVSTLRSLNLRIMAMGYPSFTGGFSKAPFDAIGDSLRGTVGIMMDMFRHPEELLEACKRMTHFMVKMGVRAGRANGHPIIFMPLHKGADGFMSEKQFETFYWPTLRDVILGLINEGMIPLLFAEGRYGSRLDLITDLPKAKTIWWFDQTDMSKAKATIGRIACLAGNVPLSLLCTGTPGDVRAYCKELIDRAGKDGGFILSTGAGMDEVKAENVKAMIDFSKEYGVYDS